MAKLNGIDVLEGEITESLSGGWVARVELDVDEDRLESGPDAGASASIVFDGGTTFVGSVIEGSVYGGRWVGRVAGGGGGMDEQLDPAHYTNVTVSTVLSELLSTAGEALDPASAPDMLAKTLPAWQRTGAARRAITTLCEVAGGRWRMTRAGLVLLVRSELWLPAVVLDYDEVDSMPDDGAIVIAIDEPKIKPGDSFEGRNVGGVMTMWSGGGLRQRLSFVGSTGAVQRTLGARVFSQMRKATSDKLDYAISYSAKVTGQSGNELSVLPDDPRIRGSGLSKVPMRHGIPGLTVTVAPGSKCMIQFENGDPSLPYATLWPDGSSVISASFGSSNAAQAMVLGNLLHTALSGLTVPTAMGPSGTPLNAATYNGFLSTKFKLDA